MSKATTSSKSIDAIQYRNGRSNWKRYLELLDWRGEIVAYLDRLARRNPPDRRMRQQVDALCLLLVELVRNPKAREVDWNYWAELGLRPLPADHPTLARELPPKAVLCLMAGLVYGTGMRLMEPTHCRRWSTPPTFEPQP